MTTNKRPANSPLRLQNPSCPAGGTTKANSGQRGVVVAPPSGNTHQQDAYQILHRGFDTLTLSVKAILSPDLYEFLESHKAIAQKELHPVLIEWNGVKLHLKGNGGSGYSFVASGGPLGANWAFKKPNAKDPWGVRVSFGSTFLATLGLGAAKAHLEGTLDRLGIRFGPNDVSIARVDVCTDILAPHFTLDPDAFVMHSATNRRDHYDAPEKSVNGKSGRVTSVTVGNTRNRQVIIYNKRLEVIQKQKPHWWTIWNKERAQNALPPLCPRDPDALVWRVEMRAGKDLLKDTWNIRTWDDLFTRFGTLCAQTGDVIRYTIPQNADSNRARWPNHPLWDLAITEIGEDLLEMTDNSAPNPVKEVIKEQHISTILKNIHGSAITLAALNGVAYKDLSEFMVKTGKTLEKGVLSDPQRSERLLDNARERYVFIG